MVADGGRWWEFARIPPSRPPRGAGRVPSLQYRGECGPHGRSWRQQAPAGGQWAALGAPRTAPNFAEPARKSCRNRSESAKTIPNTVIRVVKPLNKLPDFRIFDTHGTTLLFYCPSRTRARHLTCPDPRLVRNPRHPGGNDPRRTPASIRLGSRAP